METMQYRHFDTKRPDRTYIQFERLLFNDNGVTPSDFECYDEAQVAAWRAGEWWFMGLQARATIEIVRNGTGTIYTLTSPGLWGIESDSSEEYLDDVYREEREALLQDIIAMGQFEVTGW